jgi:hypothetical protein
MPVLRLFRSWQKNLDPCAVSQSGDEAVGQNPDGYPRSAKCEQLDFPEGFSLLLVIFDFIKNISAGCSAPNLMVTLIEAMIPADHLILANEDF